MIDLRTIQHVIPMKTWKKCWNYFISLPISRL